MAVVHVIQQISGQRNSEGIHAPDTWVYRTPPQVDNCPPGCSEETQIIGRLLVRSSKRIRQCPPFPHNFLYHAPPKFLRLFQNFYSNLSATINSAQWSTPPIPQEVGVYQGDPLSVVIFNTVINTLVDTITTKPELGYHLTNNQRINLLQYADDTCLIANSPSSCQHLLQFVDRWLSWSGMRAKVPKCHCLALKASSGKLVDPQLNIAGQQIPMAPDAVKFLGKNFQVPHDPSRARESITSHLLRMLESVNSCPLTRGQKLKLYRAGICPRLSWLLMIEDLPISWVEKKLDSLATLYLKKWAGLARPANPAVLYLPHKMGGLNLPLVSVQYKRIY